MVIITFLKKLWHFIWYDDSLASWIVNLILAFVLVKFILYPGIGFALDTSYPIVAVVSGSMEHQGKDLETWWSSKGGWYDDRDITQEAFGEFPFHNGFNKGDIMFLKGVQPKDIKVGDVLVYETRAHRNPIIHRVVVIQEKQDGYHYLTKGDNNFKEDAPVLEEQFQRTGKAVFRIPYFGWIKIWFVGVMQALGG